MPAAPTQNDKVLQLVREHGWLRARDLAHAGIPRVVLTRMMASGQLERAARGLYRLPDVSSSEHEGLVTVARKVPQAVICLLSALQFHGLTTQLPWQVWIAMPRGSHAPRLVHPPTKLVQFTGEAYAHGIERHVRDGVQLQVYGVAKTIADCFKHRNKIGLDVALEALKDARSQNRVDYDELWRSAKVCRVASVMRPYMEAVA
jgi:predicted transcriptional regulator of viral defense system